MTNLEAMRLCQHLRMVFDIVRLVDAKLNIQYSFDDSGALHAEPYVCYAVWKKTARCDNCISAICMRDGGRRTKFEFVDDQIYNVVAQSIEVEGIPYVLEIVTHVTDDTLFSAYGRSAFIDLINNFNQKLYTDVLTGIYNRKYYEEHLCRLNREISAVVMMDMDGFKAINDTYGHDAGDKALRQIGATLRGCVRADDALVRYGGDEFVLSFAEITRERLDMVLARIRTSVQQIVLPDYPDIHLSISIGGVYRRGMIRELVLEADKMLYLAKSSKSGIRICE